LFAATFSNLNLCNKPFFKFNYITNIGFIIYNILIYFIYFLNNYL
jgi:hypothetical protein